MKKLMFAALAVASCSAFAATTNEVTSVSDLALAKKALAYATKSYSIKIEGTDWTNAMEKAEVEFNKIASNIVKACTYDIEYTMPTFKDAWATVDQKGAVKGSFKFTAPAEKNGVASTKVVTTKVNGLLIERTNAAGALYVWDNTKNEYSKEYKYWGYDISEGTKLSGRVATKDGKASLNLAIIGGTDEHPHFLQGVGTGTCDKNTQEIKSVAGNFADVLCKGYGTWKLSYNKGLTTKSAGLDNEAILKLKKVELAK